MKKTTLQLDDDYDFLLIGITTHEKDYRLCWLINKQLNLMFERIKDIEVCNRKTNIVSSFSVYEHIIEPDLLSYFIICNVKSNFYCQNLSMPIIFLCFVANIMKMKNSKLC